MPETFNGSRCKATNRRGQPCGRHATDHGYCVVHSGKLNMSEIGKLGGKVRPSTKLRQQVDDDLREQAREVLSKALAGEDVPKSALDSARSLFSYRADSPPAGRRSDGEYAGERIDGRRPVSLADVLVFAHSIGETATIVAACRQVVQAADTPRAEVAPESRSSAAPVAPPEEAA